MTEENERDSSKLIFFATFLVSLVVAAGGWFLWDKLSSTQVPAAATTINSIEADACQTFIDEGLVCKQETVTDETVPRLQLLDQSVAAGTKVKKNTAVTLRYSKGPASVKLMELRNETLEEAKKELAPYGITVHEKAIVADSGLQEGRIISTSPAAGEILKNGDKVEITVANGKVNVPDWKGKPKEIVEADSKEKTITVVFQEEESDGPPDMVLSQSASGLVSMTDTITVKVSKARTVKEIEIPKVVGQAPLEAQVLLATAGFTRINLVTVEKAEAKEEKVTAVTPAEGNKARSDTVIILTVETPKK